MYLVRLRRLGVDDFVFTHTDPREEGYSGDVEDGVGLDFDMNEVARWPDGTPRPQPQLARDPNDPKKYRVFKFPQEREAAGYELVDANTPIVAFTWAEYKRRYGTFSDLAESLPQEEFEAELDRIDEATKRVWQRDDNPEPPPGSDRDAIAEWVAKQHLAVSGSIRQVVYLPAAAPPDEIRLLEVNERLPVGDGPLTPLDFGAKIAGCPVTVSVVDVTKDQLEKLRADERLLPAGWNWEGARVWGSRA
ncbi:MAG: hypothetical protein K2V38_01185 [Gemmataceae bacterium]|nr:hypothetical protein [Gemmataceae bacterium]